MKFRCLLWLFACFTLASAGDRNSDSLALLAIMDEGDNINWDTTLTIDQWDGVALNDVGRVDTLNFNNVRIRTLSDEVGALTELKLLSLKNCGLLTVPETICNLEKLLGLDLMYNYSLSSLPDSLVNLTNLLYINIGYNCFSSLPDNIGNLTKLQVLALNDNLFSELPQDLVRCKNLTTLYIARNTLPFETIELLGDSLPNLTNWMSTYYFQDAEIYFDDSRTALYTPNSGVNSSYQWYRDGNILVGETSDTLFLDSLEEKYGFFKCVISNSRVTDMTITTNLFHVDEVTAPVEALSSVAASSQGVIFRNNHIQIPEIHRYRKLTIYTPQGRVVFDRTLVGTEGLVNLPNLSAGAYVAQLEGRNSSKQLRFTIYQ